MTLEKFIQKYGKVTEEYKFYNGQVTLRYDVKDHKYLLVTPEGLEEQDGVSTICHIIDKSPALMAWACKVMAQKLLDTMPYHAEHTMGGDHPFTDSITKEQFEKLVLEAKKAKDEHLEDAGTVGHAAHKWIEDYIKSCIAGTIYPDFGVTWPMAPPEDPRAQSCCKAMLDWSKAHNVRFLKTECRVYSQMWKFAGTMDGLALVDSCDNPKCCPVPFKDRLSIIDWKTSNSLYIEYLLQTAAYQSAWIEMQNTEDPHGPLVTDRWVIRLGKEDAQFDPWHMVWEDFEVDWEGFKLCLFLSRQKAKIEARIKAKLDIGKAEIRAEKKALREAKATFKAEEKAKTRLAKQEARAEAKKAKEEAKIEARLAKKLDRALKRGQKQAKPHINKKLTIDEILLAKPKDMC